MRALALFISLFLSSAGLASAQVQEKKLMERLLEPDMSLQNNAQGKKFTVEGTATSKQARTKSFYVRERPREKEFKDKRSFLTRIFGTRRARIADQKANLTTRTKIATPQIPAATSAYASRQPAVSANETYAVSEFPGSRPFLGKGKSQKALSQQDRPLTIDEVRELLNKNK